MEFQYQAQDCRYKMPFGAIRQGTTLRILIETGGASHAFFLLRQDEKEAQWLPMEPCEGGFQYKGTVEKAGLYFYSFVLQGDDGAVRFGKDSSGSANQPVMEWQLTVYEADFQTPEWAKGIIMYQIFPDRFARSSKFHPLPAANERELREDWYGEPRFIYDTAEYKANDFFGGNLKGIEEQLDYLATLGVEAVYLNPIFESPENHRYSTADYTKIDPYLGTNADFEALAQACAQRGIRLILDGVFSHTGADSIYFNRYGHYPGNGAWNSKESPYYCWYSFQNWPYQYESWWGFENLPNVRETEPSYMAFITGEGGVLQQWQRSGANGWRLDVADGLPDAFLYALRKRVKQENPEALIIGEVWEDASNKYSYGARRPYLLGKQLDTVMNYPWREGIIRYVCSGEAEPFAKQVLDLCENYPRPALDCLMNILSTHDTNRILNQLGAEQAPEGAQKAGYVLTEKERRVAKARLQAAVFLQFTLPGNPCIYYGDEVGLEGFSDPYCRKCFPWGREDLEVYDYYKSLAQFRRRYKEAFKGGFDLVEAEDGVIAFVREQVLCCVNLSAKPKLVLREDLKKILFEAGVAECTRFGGVIGPGGCAAFEIRTK